jgi:DNA replication and repair protein RecF
VWLKVMEIRQLRNIAAAGFEPGPGLNVFHGRNAQGKTSLLEAVGILARGRSFRTEQTASVIRRGAAAALAGGSTVGEAREVRQDVEIRSDGRRLALDGRAVGPAAYQGQLEVVVYSTERLAVVRGPMRARRLFLDRSAAALWPAYRRLVRDYERVVAQRNAALQADRGELAAWTEQLVELGAELRLRRAAYVGRLREALPAAFPGPGEAYDIQLEPDAGPSLEEARRRLSEEAGARERAERRAGRSLVGPHRDQVTLSVDGRDAAAGASAGQARSLLLALTLASREVYRRVQGSAAVALLDDLDSELDHERATALCRALAGHGQAFVTTAHEAWARTLTGLGRGFHVSGGRVEAIGGA